MKKCIICGHNLKVFFKKRKFTYYKCSNCFLVSTYPLLTTKEIKSHYQKGYLSGNYSLLKEYSSEYIKIYELMAKMLEKEILKKKKSLKGLKILDIGCFTGDFLEILKKKGAHVYGIEIQKEASEIARKKFPNRIINKDVIKLKGELSNNTFDCITMLGLLEHVTDPVTTLIKVSGLLKRGGILMIQTPNSTSLPALITKNYWPPFTPKEHVFLFSKRSLNMELKKLDFTNFKGFRHFKKMPFNYLYQMLDTFGPGWKKLISPIFFILPKSIKERGFLFYLGEYIYFAKKA